MYVCMYEVGYYISANLLDVFLFLSEKRIEVLLKTKIINSQIEYTYIHT